MALTEIEQSLVDSLQLCPLKEWQRAAIFIRMDDEDKKLKMIRFIANHEKATAEALMDVAEEIAAE